MNKLVLVKEIYSKKHIQQAIDDYSQIAKIKIKEKTDFYEISFDRCKYDVSRTVAEFENYLIGLENS